MFKLIRLSRKQAMLGLGLAGTLLLSTFASSDITLDAAQFEDGRTVFDTPPRLIDFMTTRDYTNDRRATYYATVALLPETGESLKTLQIALISGRFPRLAYRLDEIKVFEGERRDRGDAFAIETAEYEDDTKTLTVRLAEAAEPGQTLTFALKPTRNPSREGVYLFEITAAPDGDLPVSQRVGTGRINIFRPDGRDPFDS